MEKLTSKELKLKKYIIETGHSTDCAASVFYQLNPKTIQPFMDKNKMLDYGKPNKYETLQKVLNVIEAEKKYEPVDDDFSFEELFDMESLEFDLKENVTNNGVVYYPKDKRINDLIRENIGTIDTGETRYMIIQELKKDGNSLDEAINIYDEIISKYC